MSARDTVDLTGMLEWRCLGPHRGGRVVAVAGHPTDPMTFYFGACAGGVWQTTDGGTVWENISDGFFKTAAIGAITVADADPNVVYAGTGETTIRGNVSHGDGVYKSTDGGRTWANVGLGATRHIARILVHPQNADVVYVAALGHAWGPNPERGVYRSTDGGKTWTLVLHRDDHTGAIDLSLDPNNPRILYAALWEAQRRPWSLTSGGPGSGLFKSTDGGDTWTELTDKPGLPKGVKGKIGVAVSPARPERVWALVEAEGGALFRSDDGGEHWTKQSDSGELRRRAWYYTHLFADPQNPDGCYVLNLQAWRSTDGGKTFTTFPTPHGDNHGLWIDPRNPRRMIEGNDGGACISFNGGLTWSTIYNQPTAQFYHVTTDTRVPYFLYGSQQDNSAISLPSLSTQGAITQNEWEEPGGGESGYIAIRPDDPNIVFAGAIGSGSGHGRLIAYDRRTGNQRNITVWPEEHGMGAGARDHKYRFQWTFPLVISRYDPNVLYAAGNQLFRSTDGGTGWETISPDLSRNDPEKLGPSGGPITRDNTGAETYCTIFAFAESPHEQGVFWAGTDDGLIHLSRDGSKTWQNITPGADLLPEWALISIIEPSPHDAATAYVAATRYKHDDTRPYLLKTTDYGQTWTPIVGGIPEGDFTRTIRADPERKGLLFAGTETGIYVSFDDGGAWRRLGGNLPVVPIHDLKIEGSDLLVATHGRSFWALDDITPLRQLADGEAKTAVYTPRDWTRIHVYHGYGYPAAEEGDITYQNAGTLTITKRQRRKPTGDLTDVFLDAGQNPPDGVIVTYALAAKPAGPLTLRFLDAAGNEIRAFTSKPAEEPAKEEQKDDKEEKKEEGPWPTTEPGLNRFVWDGRYPDAHGVPGVKMEDELHGPVAAPGRYTVELVVDGETQRAEFAIVKDPRLTTPDSDLTEQFNLLLQIRDQLSAVHDGVNTLRAVRDQVDAWQKRVKDQENVAPVAEAAAKLHDRLDELERGLIEPKADSPLCFPAALNVKLATLGGMVAEADAAPTQNARAVFADLAARADDQLGQLRATLDSDVAAFNTLVRDSGLPAVAPPAPKE
ncbi:MAG: VPS10 domain-containing protein [Thermomicrobiales bacterium]